MIILSYLPTISYTGFYPPPPLNWILTKNDQYYWYQCIYFVLQWVKEVTIYTLLVCKIVGPKIRSCKILTNLISSIISPISIYDKIMISEHDSCSPQHVANGPARDFVPALVKENWKIVFFLLHVHQISILMGLFTITRCFEEKNKCLKNEISTPMKWQLFW